MRQHTARTTTRPATLCHLGQRRRSPVENWKAPSTEYSTAQTMCTITGSGEAVMRGLAGNMWGPPANSTRRSEPAMAGITTTAMSGYGTHPIERFDRVGRTADRTFTWRRPRRASS